MVFADSSGFIAAFDGKDARHPQGARAFRALQREGERLVTTSLVFAETVTHLRRRAGWLVSRRVGDAIRRSRAIEIVHLGDDLFNAAWQEFVRNGAPKLSLCDALSIVVMRERGISRALTFDSHFAAAGFEILPWREA